MIGSLSAQPTPEEAAAAAPTDFRGLDFMVGGVWVSGDPSFASEITYLDLAGRFLMSDLATIWSQPLSSSQANGILGADPSRPGFLLMWIFDSTGSILQLECAPVAVGPETSWIFEGSFLQPGKQTIVKQQIDKQDANRLLTITHQKNLEGKWVLVGTQVFTRK